MTLAIGIDVGGTKIAGGVVDEAGSDPRGAARRVAGDRRARHRGRDREAGHRAGAPGTAIEAVGVGAAGYIDKARVRRPVRPQPGVARPRPQGRPRVDAGPARRRRERRQRRGLGRVPVRRRPRRRRPAPGHRRHGRRRRGRPRRLALPRCVRGGRRDRAHAGRARRHPVRLRQPRVLRDVCQRLGARARGPGSRAGRVAARRRPARPRGRRRRRDHRTADHRGRPGRRHRSPSSSWRRWAAGSVRASPR